MIDPFTAFAMAQGAVKGIKAAIQLGKDINGLMGDFSNFFQACDEVHIANTKERVKNSNKTDAQIGAEALKIAMASKTLRENERELKDLLVMSGNGDVWQEMVKERIRMLKERTAALAEEEKLRVAKRQFIMNSIFNTIIFGAVMMILVPILYITYKIVVGEIRI